MIAEQRRFAVAWLALLAAQVLLVCLLPLLPAQDLPQHLANARILADYERSDLPFRERYVLPQHVQSYFTAYYLLVGLGRVLGIEGAARALYVLYVIGVFTGFAALVRAQHRQATPWTALLATLVVWSPVACMGFLEFTLAVPLFLHASALLIRSGARTWIALALLSAALTTFHVVAAGAFLLFALPYALFARGRWREVLIAAGAAVATWGVWAVFGESGLGSFGGVDVAEAFRRASGLDVIDEVLRTTWNGSFVKASYTSWAVLGPFRWTGLLLVGTAAIVLVRIARQSVEPSPLRRAALAFAGMGWLLPWGFRVPSELTFLDLRLLTLAAPLLLATVDVRWFGERRAQRALIAFAAVVTLHLGFRAIGFAREAQPALALLREAATLRPRGVLLSLNFHDRSDHFAAAIRLTHFLPMYWTVRHGGINTQFWARYTHHLPIDYRPGRRPRHTPDWRPWEFTPADLKDADLLLVEHADTEAPLREREASGRVRMIVEAATEKAGCRGRWCLYVVKRAPGEHERGP